MTTVIFTACYLATGPALCWARPWVTLVYALNDPTRQVEGKSLKKGRASVWKGEPISFQV